MAKIGLLWPIFEPIEFYMDFMETFHIVSLGIPLNRGGLLLILCT